MPLSTAAVDSQPRRPSGIYSTGVLLYPAETHENMNVRRDKVWTQGLPFGRYSVPSLTLTVKWLSEMTAVCMALRLYSE